MNKHISMILVVVMAISYLTIGVRTADAGVTAADSCDDLPFWPQSVCTRYCEKLDCDTEIPQNEILRLWLCKYYEFLFHLIAGTEPPCEVDPCAELAAIAECPCPYDNVPKTPACWACDECTAGPDFIPCIGPCTTPIHQCFLSIIAANDEQGISAVSDDTATFHCIIILEHPQCGPFNAFHSSLTEDEFTTCLCRIEEYTRQLNQNPDVTVNPDQTSYSCEPPPP